MNSNPFELWIRKCKTARESLKLHLLLVSLKNPLAMLVLQQKKASAVTAIEGQRVSQAFGSNLQVLQLLVVLQDTIGFWMVRLLQ